MQSARLMVHVILGLVLGSLPISVWASSATETIQNGQHYLKHRKYHRVITESAKIDLEKLPTKEKLSIALLQGQAFLGLKRFEHAQHSFEQALTCDDCDINALLGLTWSKLLKNDLTGAAKPLDKASKLAPTNTEVLAVQGKLEKMRGNLSGAVEYYQRAIAADKKNKKARFGLATILMQENLLDPASETGSILLSKEAF